jgi:hypothetical protein
VKLYHNERFWRVALITLLYCLTQLVHTELKRMWQIWKRFSASFCTEIVAKFDHFCTTHGKETAFAMFSLLRSRFILTKSLPRLQLRSMITFFYKRTKDGAGWVGRKIFLRIFQYWNGWQCRNEKLKKLLNFVLFF